jgi:hypothetical protein
MRTFFFGYLLLKWQRLFRTISILFIIPNLINIFEKGSLFTYGYVQYNKYGLIFSVCAVLFIPLISYLVQPFVEDKNKNSKSKSTFDKFSNIMTDCEKDENKSISDEVIYRESSISNEIQEITNKAPNVPLIIYSKKNIIDTFFKNRLLYHLVINIILNSIIAYRIWVNLQVTIKNGTFNNSFNPHTFSGIIGVLTPTFIFGIILPLIISLFSLIFSKKAFMITFIILMYLMLLFNVFSLIGSQFRLNRVF